MGEQEGRFFWASVYELESLRIELRYPLVVRSGHRSREWNAHVGGAENSLHLKIAFDVSPVKRMADADAFQRELDRIEKVAKRRGWSGVGRYASFVHLDLRHLLGQPAAHWMGDLWTPK